MLKTNGSRAKIANKDTKSRYQYKILEIITKFGIIFATYLSE